MSRLRGSLFGGPSDFSQSQLPTYEQVGKQFLQTKNELKAENPKIRNIDHEVAKKVNNFGLLHKGMSDYALFGMDSMGKVVDHRCDDRTKEFIK